MTNSNTTLTIGGARLDLRCEDCITGLAALEPESVDVIVTSPPYNIGVTYGTYDDSADRDDYLAWMSRWADAVHRVLSPDGSLFLNVGGKPSDPMVPHQVLAAVAWGATGDRFTLQNTLHWVKSIAIDREAVGRGSALPDDLVVGHYKPINSSRFVNDCHEFIFHLTKSGTVEVDRLALGVAYQDKSNVTRWKKAGADRRCRGNVWFAPYDTIRSRDRNRPHPATFPVRIPENCIRLHGVDRCRLVMDPFMGIGTTAIAASRLGCDFVGFEIDEHYVRAAVDRLQDERGLF